LPNLELTAGRGELQGGVERQSVEVTGVLPDKRLEFFRQFFDDENRSGRADGHASAAIDAFGRVHVKLWSRREVRFILGGMNAVHGTSLDAVLILGAGVGDDVSHSKVLPTVEMAIAVPIGLPSKCSIFNH